MSNKRPKAELFKLTATLNDKGNVELDMDSVNPDQFVSLMEKGLPEYEGTFKVASLLRYLKSMGDEMMDKSSRYI
jgi:hypothetical protein|tara:strand:+ start:1059 stop:1283 length:225 start_codon:yes stop_codon:yes gene_type:complete